MSSNELITLTNIQEDYLDGVLQIDYTRHWSQNLYHSHNEVPELIWKSEHSNYFIRHRLNIFPSYTGGIIDFESFKTRAFCHYLLDLLPDEGLEEIKESLEDAIQFYLTKPRNEFAQLPSPSFEINLGEAYERPVFQIAED